MDKALSRAQTWASQGLGLFYSLIAYKIYIISVLSFVAQLEEVPVRWEEHEGHILRTLIPGPFRWALPEDFRGLRRDFGFPVEAPDLRVVSQAARFRVAHREAASRGGLGLRRWLGRLEAAWGSSEAIVRLGTWREWLNSSYVRILTDNLRALAASGVTLVAVEERAAGGRPRPWSIQVTSQVTRLTQKMAHAMLKEQQQRFPVIRLRAKLENLELSVFPRRAADRSVNFLQRLPGLVPPRVMAAVIRTYFGGWCTKSRFGARGRCVFGCLEYPDSLSHYLACPIASGFATTRFRLPQTHDPRSRRAASLALDSTAMTDAEVTRRALWMAVVYRLHCRY